MMRFQLVCGGELVATLAKEQLAHWLNFKVFKDLLLFFWYLCQLNVAIYFVQVCCLHRDLFKILYLWQNLLIRKIYKIFVSVLLLWTIFQFPMNVFFFFHWLLYFFKHYFSFFKTFVVIDRPSLNNLKSWRHFTFIVWFAFISLLVTIDSFSLL